MSEFFSEYPMTVGELKADKSQRADSWTPRDLLINLLRFIDKGSPVKEMVVAFQVEIENGGRQTSYAVSAPDVVTTLGMLERAKHKINNPSNA